MARYIQFATGDEEGSTILVEVDLEGADSENISTPSGLEKVGIKDKVQNTIAIAQTSFSTAIKNAIQHNVQAFIDAVDSLSEPPTEVEISFGLKATGEIGNVAIGKTGGEVNYTVKLFWKRTSRETK